MKKRASVAIVVALGAVVTLLVVLAYHGPNTAVDPNKDYSKSQVPSSQVLSATTASSDQATPSAVTTVQGSASTGSASTTTTSGSGANSQPTATTNAAVASTKSDISGAVSTNPGSGSGSGKDSNDTSGSKHGMAQSLVDVLSNLQL